MKTLCKLNEIMNLGRMPRGRIIWLGLGITPPKTNSIKIEIDKLPSREECTSITGLDVILTYHGNFTRYGILFNLCSSLLSSNPRRLQIVDIDIKKVAYLKLGGQL